jgi:hypothetical protein
MGDVKGLETTIWRSNTPAGGGQLVTLEDAGAYITELPKANQQLDEWQTAIEALLLVVKQNGPTMFARMGVMKALNRHVEPVFNRDRKETHWGIGGIS